MLPAVTVILWLPLASALRDDPTIFTVSCCNLQARVISELGTRVQFDPLWTWMTVTVVQWMVPLTALGTCYFD